MVAVVRVDAELVDDIEVVFAPILEVHQRVVQWHAVVAGEGVDPAQGFGSGEVIGNDDLSQQAGELGVGEADAVEGLEFFTKVPLQGGAVGDVGAVVVTEAAELLDEDGLMLVF